MPTQTVKVKLDKCEQDSGLYTVIGVVNGKSETRRDAKIGILKSEPEMKKHNDFIEKQIWPMDTKSETPRSISRLCEIPRLG